MLGAFVLLTWGLVFAIGGALILWTGALDIPTDISLSTAMQDIVDEFNRQAAGYGGILLILGIVHMIGAVGILAHRNWGRAFGIVLGLLGTIWGVALLISSITFDAGDVTVEGAFSGETPALGAAILVLASYLIVFLGMFMGRRHFRKKGVSS